MHGVVFWWTQYCIALTGILYMGLGVPIPAQPNSWVVVLLHGVVFWWTQYCIAQTGILYMGPGVPIPANKCNSWVVVLTHGVGFWWTQYCIAQTGILCMGLGVSIQVQQLGGSVTAWCWILVDSGMFLAKIARGLGLRQCGWQTWNILKMLVRHRLLSPYPIVNIRISWTMKSKAASTKRLKTKVSQLPFMRDAILGWENKVPTKKHVD